MTDVTDGGKNGMPGWLIPELIAAGVIAILSVCAVLFRQKR